MLQAPLMETTMSSLPDDTSDTSQEDMDDLDAMLQAFGLSRQRKIHPRRAALLRKRFEPTPFLDQPRTQRRDRAASMNWRIATDPNGRGLFTTHQILPGSRELPLVDGDGLPNLNFWANFHFASVRPLREGRLFYATAKTLTYQAVNDLLEMAEAHVEQQLTPVDRRNQQPRYSYTPLKDGGVEMTSTAHPRLESLGGLTVGGAKAAWLRQHWDDLESLVTLCPSAVFHPDYSQGIGVHFLVDLDTIDCDTIPAIIERFRRGGEQAYEDPAVSLKKYGSRLREILEVHLWHFDAQQAEAEGRDRPAPPREAVCRLADYQSQGIRWP